jgi:predicted phage-related endonuclease
MTSNRWRTPTNRQVFIGGSDARIIMGNDEAALVQLWREKRGEAEPEDLSGNLIVQLGVATEELNRSWYERNTGRRVTDVQRNVKHSAIAWMAATLMASARGPKPCSSPSSCCHGHSLKWLPPESIWLRSSITCGSRT